MWQMEREVADVRLICQPTPMVPPDYEIEFWAKVQCVNGMVEY